MNIVPHIYEILAWANYRQKAIDPTRKKLINKNMVRTIKPCLRCRKPYRSTKHNRICYACHQTIDDSHIRNELFIHHAP